ncbi:MAG: hypothetical protein M2R45_02266 [Verrucomicrobia subdivision 3 bacterium]|nr:hypothetical protein [Limisphaerales bacterium]MCS1413948.1 hypothetical protein [Limisphaerales bacterium]
MGIITFSPQWVWDNRDLRKWHIFAQFAPFLHEVFESQTKGKGRVVTFKTRREGLVNWDTMEIIKADAEGEGHCIDSDAIGAANGLLSCSIAKVLGLREVNSGFLANKGCPTAGRLGKHGDCPPMAAPPLLQASRLLLSFSRNLQNLGHLMADIAIVKKSELAGDEGFELAEGLF